jgi:hypothetical protein
MGAWLHRYPRGADGHGSHLSQDTSLGPLHPAATTTPGTAKRVITLTGIRESFKYCRHAPISPVAQRFPCCDLDLLVFEGGVHLPTQRAFFDVNAYLHLPRELRKSFVTVLGAILWTKFLRYMSSSYTVSRASAFCLHALPVTIGLPFRAVIILH